MAACRLLTEAWSKLAARALVDSGLAAAAAAAQAAAGMVVVLLAEWQYGIAPAAEGILEVELAEVEVDIAVVVVEAGRQDLDVQESVALVLEQEADVQLVQQPRRGLRCRQGP